MLLTPPSPPVLAPEPTTLAAIVMVLSAVAVRHYRKRGGI